GADGAAGRRLQPLRLACALRCARRRRDFRRCRIAEVAACAATGGCQPSATGAFRRRDGRRARAARCGGARRPMSAAIFALVAGTILAIGALAFVLYPLFFETPRPRGMRIVGTPAWF